MMDRYKLKQTLENDIITVVFEKKDGTLREMKCTLKPDALPQFLSEHEPSPLGETLSVWDVEANGWRSFRFDSIKQIIVG